MKRLITLILCLIVALGAFPSTTVASSDIRVILNGQQLSFDVAPIIIDGRTLVPMRVIFEALGADIEWNQNTREVTGVRGNTTVRLQIDNAVATVNGNNVTLDVPARLIDGRTLVPLRFVGESLDADVQWNGATRTVTIDSAGQSGGIRFYNEFPTIPRFGNVSPSLYVSYYQVMPQDFLDTLRPPQSWLVYMYNDVETLERAERYLLQYSNLLQSLGWRLVNVNRIIPEFPLDYSLISPDNRFRVRGRIVGTSHIIEVVSYPQGVVRTYSSNLTVPSFGAFTGLTPITSDSLDGTVAYFYDARQVTFEMATNYRALLADFGFLPMGGNRFDAMQNHYLLLFTVNPSIHNPHVMIMTGFVEGQLFMVGIGDMN